MNVDLRALLHDTTRMWDLVDEVCTDADDLRVEHRADFTPAEMDALEEADEHLRAAWTSLRDARESLKAVQE